MNSPYLNQPIESIYTDAERSVMERIVDLRLNAKDSPPVTACFHAALGMSSQVGTLLGDAKTIVIQGLEAPHHFTKTAAKVGLLYAMAWRKFNLPYDGGYYFEGSPWGLAPIDQMSAADLAKRKIHEVTQAANYAGLLLDIASNAFEERHAPVGGANLHFAVAKYERHLRNLLSPCGVSVLDALRDLCELLNIDQGSVGLPLAPSDPPTPIDLPVIDSSK